MHTEMSESLKLALVIFILGGTVFILMVLMTVGDTTLKITVSSIDSMFTASTTSEFQDIGNHDSNLLAATLYVSLKKNVSQVESISGTAYGETINTIDDLKKIFSKKVYVTVSRNAADIEMFRFVISQ